MNCPGLLSENGVGQHKTHVDCKSLRDGLTWTAFMRPAGVEAVLMHAAWCKTFHWTAKYTTIAVISLADNLLRVDFLCPPTTLKPETLSEQQLERGAHTVKASLLFACPRISQKKATFGKSHLVIGTRGQQHSLFSAEANNAAR